jgi:hypothetical protein
MLVGTGKICGIPQPFLCLGKRLPIQGFGAVLARDGAAWGRAIGTIGGRCFTECFSWHQIVMLNVVPGASDVDVDLVFLGTLSFVSKGKNAPETSKANLG